MIDWIREASNVFSFTSWMGICLYWLPLVVCIYGYTLRTWFNYKKDLVSRDRVQNSQQYYYYPTDTIGDLVGRAVVSVVPIINLWACLFDVSPKLFASFFGWINKVLDTPIVKKRKN